MEFEEQRIFHVYNRGNNREPIFFNRGNYLFFLKKIKKYMLPYGNLLAWCLMTNHFHLLFEVDRMQVSIESRQDLISTQSSSSRSLNDSIGIMLRSYTRAINKEQNRTGSLFQQATKAICLNDPEFSPAYFNTAFGALGNVDIEGADYLMNCFRYIHLNPLHHGVVNDMSAWEFSSYADLFRGRNGILVNRARVKALGLLDKIDL